MNDTEAFDALERRLEFSEPIKFYIAVNYVFDRIVNELNQKNRATAANLYQKSKYREALKALEEKEEPHS